MSTKVTCFFCLLLVFLCKISQILTEFNNTTTIVFNKTTTIVFNDTTTISPNATEINQFNKENDTDAKISGGYIGDPALWGKFTVSIRHMAPEQEEFGKGHFCGGAIITRSVILTASHCLYSLAMDATGKKPNIIVVVGARKLHRYTKMVQVIPVEDIALHPEYDPVLYHNDIALIILEHKIIIDGKTSAICTLPSVSPHPLMKCTAAGWGAIYYQGPMADELLYADMLILSNEQCRSDYPTKTDKEVCATAPQDVVVDTCQGDSGGPLFCDGTLTGIVSRGRPCGITNSSGLYTAVYDYLDWIRSEKNQAIIIHQNFCLIHLWMWTLLYFGNSII